LKVRRSLFFGGRSICGSLAGTAIDTEDALAFSVLENLRSMMIEGKAGSAGC
jgi:D-arabinose 1-dehydrogenase-like Zn-dependent alcohol dehydrogenase